MTTATRPAYVARVQHARMLAAVRNLMAEHWQIQARREWYAILGGLALVTEPAPCQWQDDYVARLEALARGIVAPLAGPN